MNSDNSEIKEISKGIVNCYIKIFSYAAVSIFLCVVCYELSELILELGYKQVDYIFRYVSLFIILAFFSIYTGRQKNTMVDLLNRKRIIDKQ